MLNKQKVYDQLKKVIDPELGINIVDLGLIYEVKLEDKELFILMTLTFPGCPLGGIIHKEIKDKLGEINEIEKVDIKITFDPPWDFSKVSEQARADLGLL